MEFADGRLFLENVKSQDVHFIINLKTLHGMNSKNEVKVDYGDFKVGWLLNNIDWYSMGKTMAIERDTIKAVTLDGQLYIMDIYEVYDEIIDYFKNKK